MTYAFNEGQLSLSEEYQDDSVNIFKFKTLQSTLVITRARLAEGETLEGYFDQQIAQLKRAMKHFLIDERKVVALHSADPERIAYETNCEFEQKGQKMHQLLLVTLSGHQVMVFTYAQARPFSEADQQHWQQIKTGLILK